MVAVVRRHLPGLAAGFVVRQLEASRMRGGKQFISMELPGKGAGLADGIRADFDAFAAQRFLIGSESQLVDQIGRYGEATGTEHILLRVQWPGLGQKMVVRTLERLGRVVEQL